MSIVSHESTVQTADLVGVCLLSEPDFREWRGGMLGLESPSGWEKANAAAGNGVGPK